MILVTGGAGFIGSNFILDWCRSSDEQVINIDKLTYAGNLMNLSSLKDSTQHEFFNVDIGNSNQLSKILKKYKPRAVINFAAESHVDRSIHGPRDFIYTNIIGTYELLEVVNSYWANLQDSQKADFKFMHISTDEVYGSLLPEDSSFTEKNQYKPNSPYSASKASSDHLVRAFNKTYQLPTITTNCSNNYGPFQFPEKLIPLTINNIIHNKKIPVYGDGMQVRDWLYVNDHCDALRLILSDGSIGDIYNIGGLNEKTNIDVISMICNRMDDIKFKKDIPSINLIQHVKDRAGHDTRYSIDISKVSKTLDWKPKETFESGIDKTIKWYLDNQNWVDSVSTGEYVKWMKKNYSELL